MYKLPVLAIAFLVSGCGAAPRKVEMIEEEVVVTQEPVETNKASNNLVLLENEAQLNDLIASGKLILVDFFASWCGPCKQFLGTLDKVAPEFPNVIFVKVNVDEFKNLAAKYGISSIPSIKIFSNGDATKAVDQFTGAKSPTELRKLLQKLGA